jgi:hypothetical protein
MSSNNSQLEKIDLKYDKDDQVRQINSFVLHKHFLNHF